MNIWCVLMVRFCCGWCGKTQTFATLLFATQNHMFVTENVHHDRRQKKIGIRSNWNVKCGHSNIAPFSTFNIECDSRN